MGIAGLFPLLKSIQKPCNLKKFAGQTIGVDAYGWLHRGTVACAMELALGKPTTKFVDYSMNRVRMLIHFGVTPYLVFDGDYLPSKSLTENERASKRRESKKLGLELHQLGKVSQAHLELQKAVDVTPLMARQLIEELKKLNVQYLVAPYEADAQLAYLERKGIIAGILSEDSDLLVFGARCLLTKLDQYGDCIEINRKDFTACREISLVGWSDAEFRLMAILSGCDYLANIDKMGLKTAYRLVRKYKTIERILQMLAFDSKYRIPTGYLELFRRAELTFLHQRVFCPIANDVVMMTGLDTGPEPEGFSFIGSRIDREVAIGVSRGDLDPMTKKPINFGSMASSSPSTPGLSSRPQSGCKLSDLKGNQSIEVFFKAKRTPLAELDPNSFTPSPSQQRLLHSNRSWMSSSAPAMPSLPPQNIPLSISATPSTSNIAVGGPNGLHSLTQPLKRKRLCSEHESQKGSANQTPESAGEIGLGRSQYFTSSLTKPCPSIKNKRKNKRVNEKEINMWSDDSVEDVMAGLPDLSDYHHSSEGKSINIFRDDNQETLNSKPVKIRNYATGLDENSSLENSQCSATTRLSKESIMSMNSSATSLTSSSTLVAKTLAKNISAELEGFSEKFSYKPNPTKSALNSSNSEHQSLGNYKSNRPSTSIAQVRQGGMTALQRMRSEAVKRSQANFNPSHDSSLHTKANSTPQHPETSPTLSLSSVAHPKASATRGSEDMVIPDSENDSEGTVAVSEAEIDEPKAPKLNLGQFAFSNV